MRFTIIIPVFNKEKYLRRCLDSVVDQTSRNFECLLIDDGSTDKSNEICREYEDKFAFFKLYKKENGGLSDARNYGIERASGEYLLFLDADDCIDKNLICICEATINKNDVDIIAFGMDCVYTIEDIGYENESLHIKENSDLIYDILSDKVGYSVCNKVYKKDVFNTLRFIKGRIFEDQFIIFKLLNGRNTIVLENCMYFYFQDVEDSLSKMKVYPETYDYIEAAIEITKDVMHCDKYLKLAAQEVYERIILLLTNIYYEEGQFRRCKRENVDRIIRENKKIIMRGLPMGEKLLLFSYLYSPDFLSKIIIRMRFKPIVYLKGKLGLGK